ncbi:flagellar protein FliT [Brevibacillus sp. NRS-1366]|uniref:flagellar protein FliT n=1 Tax=Brevibacillus sp. NRS-1366 TaxID=3233899 RepID=UPI003D1A9FB9
MGITRANSIEILELLLQQLLLRSRELEQVVMQEESDPDEWLELLDKRGELMQQIADTTSQGVVLPPEWKAEYLDPFLELDQRIIPIMEEKQDQLSDKIAQLQRGKAVNKQYNGYGTAPYGAFFDTKK